MQPSEEIKKKKKMGIGRDADEIKKKNEKKKYSMKELKYSYDRL